MTDTTDDEEESACGKPCDPNRSCDECEPYWQRMVAEGYWNRERHRWTDKGWKEITKWP
jgi:hypothetical protein